MTSQPLTHSTSSPTVALGSVRPRIWTPPLRDLTDEDASWGYDFADFCALIGWPLDPWQRWLAVHLGELFPDGSPRYRKAIILVARQNGKTIFTRLLILYWMFVERVPEILGTSTDRAGAKRSWRKVVEMAERTDVLAAVLAPRHTALQIGEEDFWNEYGSHYRFAAPTRRAGRGDTLNRALLDELREHRNRDTWDAVIPTMNAVADGLVVCISNEGDAESVVLHEEYDAALGFIESGEGDPRTFLAAWSSPTDADPLDVDALAQANPGLGHRVQLDALLGQASAARKAGGETLARFRIEILCQRVDQLEGAFRPEDWAACGTQEPVDLAEHRRRVALCFDVSRNADHATLTAAALIDGVVHVDVLKGWDGYDCRKRMRAELPDLVAEINPARVAWFPGGPAAAVADELTTRKRLRNVKVVPIRAEDVVRACMGLEEVVAAGQLRHTFDPLLEPQVKQTQKLQQGDGWRFARRGQLPIDAVYAAAGAVHIARTMLVLAPLTD